MLKKMPFLSKEPVVIGSMMLLGALSTLAFAPYHQIWILFLTFAVLMSVLNQKRSWRILLGRVFVFGFGFGAVSMGWVCEALMIDGGQFAWLIPLALIGLGIFFGFCFVLPAWGALFVPIGVRRWLVFGALFVLVEWGRSWFIFGGLPWNLLGNVWTGFLPVLQVASVFGVYGLSLLSVLLFTAPALWKNKPKLVVAVFGGACFVALMGGIRLYTTNVNSVWGVRLRLVQPNIPQTLKWDWTQYENNFSKLIRLSRKDNQKITHVIWPESAVPFIMNENEGERIRLMSAVRQGSFLLTGGLRRVAETNEIANSFFILDDLADIRGYYDKAHLVPFGEYVPLRGILPIDKIVPFESDFYRGSGVTTMIVPKAPPVSPLICYEIIFSKAVVDSKNRPAWIVNVTNDAWFGLSAGPYQHYDAAVMRAVEEGLPVVRVANHGVSGVIDPLGRSVGRLPLGQEGILDADLPVALPETIFARFGQGIWAILVALILLFSVKRQNKS